jgi:hypothetical protein
VDVEKNRNAWKKIVSEKGLYWKQYWDMNSIEAKKLYIDSFPTNFLLDPAGKVIESNITLESLEEFLRHRTRLK